MGGRQSFVKRFLASRLFLLLCLFLVVIFLTGFLKTLWRDYEIRQEISALVAEKERWEKNKLELLGQLKEIKNEEFAEKEARLRFGLGQPGESLAIITNGFSSAIDTTQKGAGAKAKVSNPINWWHYFFQ